MSLQIKPLVWEPIDIGECLEGTGDYYLCHQAGRYWIHRKASGDLRGSDGIIVFYEDRDEAKAAAQADYESRILAALPPPTTEAAWTPEKYAEQLAVLTRQRCYPEVPQFEPMTGDIMGLLSQIDNMLTGMIRALPPPAAGEGLEPVAWEWAWTDDPFYWNLQRSEPATMNARIIKRALVYAATPAARAAVLEEPRPLDEWCEDDGNVVWWCWRDGAWLGEPVYIGTPLDIGQTVEVTVAAHRVDKLMRAQVGGWPGYHTHWTPHPSFPAALKEKT